MARLQLRTGQTGALLATALATGAALLLASSGSSSPDADAKTARTAARLAKLATRAKTALANRSLKESRSNLNDCMMLFPVVEKSSALVGGPRIVNPHDSSAI